MNILAFLQHRASIPAKYLTEPAPDDEAIADIIKAGLTAPDHAAMRPWRFMIIRGDARRSLGEIFKKAALQDTPDVGDEKLQRIGEKAMRSPLIITVIAKITPDHPKTPVVEQVLSAGAAAQQMQLAAHALGFGSVWLTGPNAHHPMVKEALGIPTTDQIVGFLYMGTSSIDAPRPRRPAVNDHLEEWKG